MALQCPRCGIASPDPARFCRNCGLRLTLGGGGVLGAGRAPHPEPLSPTDETHPIDGAADLYFAWQVAGGGTPLLGTEPLEVTVFNGGYNLAEVTLRVRGEGKGGRELFAVEREIGEWLRGQSVRLEIPSWELPDPVAALRVEFVQAKFGEHE